MDTFCRVCRTPFLDPSALDQNDVCSICRASLSNFDAAYSYGTYEGALQKLIQLFKYGKVESLSGPLSRLLLSALPFGENFDVVMPVPMHWRKQWQRGFNQAELLAVPVARRYGIKLATNLRRSHYGKAQASLSSQDRQKNLMNSFLVRRPAQLFGERILLIDDVLTTGATLRAAAAALKACGAARVTALTLARVDHRTLFYGGRQRLRATGRSAGFETSSAAAERKTQTAVIRAK